MGYRDHASSAPDEDCLLLAIDLAVDGKRPIAAKCIARQRRDGAMDPEFGHRLEVARIPEEQPPQREQTSFIEPPPKHTQ